MRFLLGGEFCCSSVSAQISLSSIDGLFFVYFGLFVKGILAASRIQTQIVGVEGKDTDHSTTTDALNDLKNELKMTKIVSSNRAIVVALLKPKC